MIAHISMNPTRRLLLALLIALPAGCKREAPAPPATKPATQAATAPATKPALADYVELLRLHDPQVPATQPLGVPVDLEDAGHFVLNEPIYICPRGDLWITHPDAPATENVLKKAVDEQLHLTRERVKYVQWAVDDEGKPLARLAVESPQGIKWIDKNRAISAGRKDYRWNDALGWGDRIVVPTERGVTIFSFTPEFNEDYHEIADAGSNPPRVLFDAQGVLAWSPWEGKQPGGPGVHRFVNGKWIDLTATAQWPRKIIHLVPLLDGSVLQLIAGDDGKLQLAMSSLDNPAVDEKAIEALVLQLSDDDPEKREHANAELTRYGVASWPVLERLVEDQPPEAKFRIEALLKDRIQPTLGGKTLVDGRASVADRFTDGGVLLHAPAGVSMPAQQPDKPPIIVKPAWISIRPGRVIELLEPVLVKEADPAKQRFFAFVNEWIVSDNVIGPRRLLGNHVEPMLRKEEAQYSHVVGADPRGRWYFRTSPDAPQTLVLDPTVPDPTPRLPVWLMAIEKGASGWSNEDWPAVNRGGPRHSWMLREHSWSPLDERKDRLNTQANKSAPLPTVQIPPPPHANDATTKPATTRTTAPATTTATTLPTEPPLLTDSDGRRYYDANRTLRVIDRDGKEIVWTLPANAVGADDFAVVLIRTADGKLFLFNAPGRVVRIKPTVDEAEPFKIEAVFTNRIPSDKIRRIWLDPAGRIVMVYDEHRMAVLFPGGRIPSEIAKLMLASEREQKP